MSSPRLSLAFLMGALATVILAAGGTSQAACVPSKLPTPAPKDPLARVLSLQTACPRNAQELGKMLEGMGSSLEPTMVNFVGFHNPAPGAFFIFEIVSTAAAASSAGLTIARGDLVFGHFTTASGDGQLVANQSSLVIEAIAWDPGKQFYNFYELDDDGWSYRGDSKDILDDIQLLHRNRTGTAGPFGPRLRCSGCHVNGGLVQKELAAPHNDWFVGTRHLPLGSLRPDPFVSGRIAKLVDGGELSRLVVASARRLADSPGYQRVLAARSMQERLRPLFCPVELNIESDSDPADDHRPAVRIPATFFADRRLATANIAIPWQHYDAALQSLHASLPGTRSPTDADHAWLTPVKAHSDIVAVDALIEQGVVDEEFVADVLAVDFTNPVFSRRRCDLLTLVPAGGAGFAMRFQDALRAAEGAAAAELLSNLADPQRTAAFHRSRAAGFLASCQQRASNPAAVLEWYRLVAQRRAEVAASEISQNPRGHILEDPGRVVFPSVQPRAVAGRLVLTPSCRVQ